MNEKEDKHAELNNRNIILSAVWLADWQSIAKVINSLKELQLSDDSGLTGRLCDMTFRTINQTTVIQIC